MACKYCTPTKLAPYQVKCEPFASNAARDGEMRLRAMTYFGGVGWWELLAYSIGHHLCTVVTVTHCPMCGSELPTGSDVDARIPGPAERDGA